MKKVICKIYCWIFSHDFVKVGDVNNGRSNYGTYHCIRCGYDHHWQYDYGM